MAKKKDTDPMPPATKSPTADRHKSRRTISFTPELVELLRKLAKRNHRPLYWEARLAIENHLKANGLEPPESPEQPPEPPED